MNLIVIENFAERASNGHQKELLWMTHDIIEQTLPQCTLSMKWNVPVYDYIKYLCYINYHRKHLYVSFTQGKYLTPRACLDQKGTKLVAKYHIRDKKDIYESELIEILLEAEALQQSMFGK